MEVKRIPIDLEKITRSADVPSLFFVVRNALSHAD